MTINLAGIKKAIIEGKFQWRMHALIRLAERNISQQDVLDAIIHGECIQEYPEDKPFPSALFLSIKNPEQPLHVAVSYYEQETFCYIITCYNPDSEHFEEDWKTRKK